jgi:hypothetical protein
MQQQQQQYLNPFVSGAVRVGRAQFPADMVPLAEGTAGPQNGGAAFVEYVGPIDEHLYVLREAAHEVFFRTVDRSSPLSLAGDAPAPGHGGTAVAVSPAETAARAVDGGGGGHGSVESARHRLRRYLRLPAMEGAPPDPHGIDRSALWRGECLGGQPRAPPHALRRVLWRV